MVMRAFNHNPLAALAGLCLPFIAGPASSAGNPDPAPRPTLFARQDLGQPADNEILSKTAPKPAIFRLTVDYSCPDEAPAASLFLSILDEFISAELDNSPKDVIVKVPAARLAAIRETVHCPTPGDQLLPDQAQAFATLTCIGEAITTRATIAQPLSIWFRCPEGQRQPTERQTDDLETP
jgi:hypothetical protein